jgi:hypothetical protein
LKPGGPVDLIASGHAGRMQPAHSICTWRREAETDPVPHSAGSSVATQTRHTVWYRPWDHRPKADDGAKSFCVRLRAHPSKLFICAGSRCVLRVGRRDVTVESDRKGQALEDANWIFLRAAGFASRQDARKYGEQLRVVTQFAELCDSLGIDVRVRFPQWKNWDRAPITHSR